MNDPLNPLSLSGDGDVKGAQCHIRQVLDLLDELHGQVIGDHRASILYSYFKRSKRRMNNFQIFTMPVDAAFQSSRQDAHGDDRLGVLLSNDHTRWREVHMITSQVNLNLWQMADSFSFATCS